MHGYAIKGPEELWKKENTDKRKDQYTATCRNPTELSWIVSGTMRNNTRKRGRRKDYGYLFRKTVMEVVITERQTIIRKKECKRAWKLLLEVEEWDVQTRKSFGNFVATELLNENFWQKLFERNPQTSTRKEIGKSIWQTKRETMKRFESVSTTERQMPEKKKNAFTNRTNWIHRKCYGRKGKMTIRSF